jgi:hypothetical protein
MKLKTAERARWRIAYLLNRLPGQCWTDLVLWVLGSDKYRRRFPWSPVGPDCLKAGDQSCYCGKLRAARQDGER